MTTAVSTTHDLPADLARSRVIGANEAARFLNLSLPHFRRHYRTGKVPKPIKITERKLGWRWGDLNDFVASRTSTLKAA